MANPVPLPIKAGAKRVYDVAVIGPDLGGAAAAAMIARNGLRVLLCPLGAATAARESEGWLLPAAHPILPPLRQLSAALAPIDDLGLGQDLQRVVATAHHGAFQLLGEKLRLSLPDDPARRRAELRRELSAAAAAQAEAALESLPDLGRSWNEFLSEAPPWPARGFFERRRVKKLWPTPPALPEGLIGDALHALAPFAASLVGDSAPEATAREAAAMFRSPLKLFGGEAQLAEMMRKKAIESGTEILSDVPSDLRLEKKGIVFQLGGGEVRATSVVLACGPEEIGGLLQGGARPERKILDDAAISVGRKVTLAHFVVGVEGIPWAMEEAALLLGNAAGPLLLSSLPARRARGEPGPERIVTAARISDAGFTDSQGLLEAVRGALEQVLPFFDRHILHQAADLSPSQPHVVFRPHDDGEPLGLRPVPDAHERILFASAATYPGFGLEGQLLAARAASDRAAALSGRKEIAV